MLFLCRIKENDYRLIPETPKIDVTKLSQTYVLNENRKNIEDFYSVEEQELLKFFEKFKEDENNFSDNDNLNFKENCRNKKKYMNNSNEVHSKNKVD